MGSSYDIVLEIDRFRFVKMRRSAGC